MTTNEIDATVASLLYFWTDVRLELGRFRGKPPVGLRKDVPSYSSDLRLALQAARVVANRIDAEVKISINAETIEAKAEDSGGFEIASFYGTKIADLPRMVIDCSIAAIRRPIASRQRGEKA